MPETLAINEVFGPTVQGEGPAVGEPAVFVRLARCNLDCVWCDTAYSWDWKRYDPADEVHPTAPGAVVQQVRDLAGAARLVVVTGGEPLLQARQLLPFMRALDDAGFHIDVETNATRAPVELGAMPVRTFVCSPKLANSLVPHDKRVRPDVLARFNDDGRAVLKFVVEEPGELDEAAEIAALAPDCPVYVMPQGVVREDVLRGGAALVEAAAARGWHFTTRLHILTWGAARGH